MVMLILINNYFVSCSFESLPAKFALPNHTHLAKYTFRSVFSPGSRLIKSSSKSAEHAPDKENVVLLYV